MKREEIIHYVIDKVNPVIINDTNLGLQKALPEYLAMADHYLDNLKIDKPAQGLLGKMGATKQWSILGSDREKIINELRPIIEERCVQSKKVHITRQISSSAINALVEITLAGCGYKWAVRDLQHKSIVSVWIGNRRLEIAVHYSKNMQSDINNILPAVKDIEQMRAKYGSDFKYI